MRSVEKFVTDLTDVPTPKLLQFTPRLCHPGEGACHRRARASEVRCATHLKALEARFSFEPSKDLKAPFLRYTASPCWCILGDHNLPWSGLYRLV